MEEQIQENKMGYLPIPKLLVNMSLPIIISMIIQALYNVVDSIFVSKVSEDAFTAVSMAFPIQTMMIAVATGTGVGINAILSKSLGEKNQHAANKTANTGILLALCSMLVFMLLGFFGTRLFFSVQTKDETIIQYGVQYLSIITIFSLGIFGQITLERLLQATGKSFYTMITQGTGAIINLILDPILIFGLAGAPKLGVAGAAIATVCGQIAAFVIALVFNLKLNKEIQLNVKEICKPEGWIIKKIYMIGIPSILMQSIGSMMNFCMNKILVEFTSTAVAVFGAYYKLQSFVFMPVMGLNNGMVPIISYNYGAKKKDRIMQTLKISVITGVCIMLAGFFALQFIPGTLLKLFSASDAMLAMGEPALRIMSISYIFAGFCIVCSSYFQALGYSIYSLYVSVARQLFVLIPVAYLFSLTGVLNLVWLAFPIAEIASVTFSMLFLRKTMKKLDF